MNMEFIKMTTQASSLDEFLRAKLADTQSTSVSIANDNAMKLMHDTLHPMEMRMSGSIDNLVREAVQTKTYLTKVNDL